MAHDHASRMIQVGLWQDLVILGFMLCGVFVLYPLYAVNGHLLLVIQGLATIGIVLLGAILRRKLRRFLDHLHPFVDEIASFGYIFVTLILMSLVIPYLHTPRSINTNVLYFGFMGSLLFALIYFIRVYPSFKPRGNQSLAHLVTLTLEMLKLGITLWILFFLSQLSSDVP